jgi:hypothetical protein
MARATQVGPGGVHQGFYFGFIGERRCCVHTDAQIRGQIRVVWDAFYRSHYWVLSGTRTVLDGTVLATNCGRPFSEQACEHLAELNRRRSELGLQLIDVDEI